MQHTCEQKLLLFMGLIFTCGPWQKWQVSFAVQFSKQFLQTHFYSKIAVVQNNGLAPTYHRTPGPSVCANNNQAENGHEVAIKKGGNEQKRPIQIVELQTRPIFYIWPTNETHYYSSNRLKMVHFYSCIGFIERNN